MRLGKNIYYKTSDGLLDIEFLFVDLGFGKGWRAYIISDINYQRFSPYRSDKSADTHRNPERNDKIKRRINKYIASKHPSYNTDSIPVYICWSTAVGSYENMKLIAQTWSEITSYYIRRGGSFEYIQPKLKSKGIIPL